VEETPLERRRPSDAEAEPGRGDEQERVGESARGRLPRALVWGGLLVALLLMFAGTLVTVVANRRWGIYLFLASALLYIVCRCMTIGVLNTAPKVFSVLLLVAGAFIMSRWPVGSVMGVVGAACLVGALALMVLGGLGYARGGRQPGKTTATHPGPRKD